VRVATVIIVNGSVVKFENIKHNIPIRAIISDVVFGV